MSGHHIVVVLVAAVAAFVLGALWYSPLLFANAWVKAHGHTPEKLAQLQAGAPKAYAVSFVAFIVMAAVLSMLLDHLGVVTAHQGALWAAHIWLGFAATIGLMATLYSGARFSVWAIDAGYQLVYLVLMGAIIGGWR